MRLVDRFDRVAVLLAGASALVFALAVTLASAVPAWRVTRIRAKEALG